jgi:MFS family permease
LQFASEKSFSQRLYRIELQMSTCGFLQTAFVIPQMSLPVLFDEISAELGLSLVQVGWIWGAGSVLGILVGLIGRTVGDRFGPRRTLAVACLLMGIAGAAWGLSNGFKMLTVTTILTGFAQWSIPMNVHKTCGVWFPKEQLGIANSVVSVGMALGFLLGGLLAATVFSPIFGGWRNVLFVYGAVAILFAMFWWFSHEKAGVEDQQKNDLITFREAICQVIRLRNVWILCIATAGVSGCVNGMLGFLPLYLRVLGWKPAIADSTLASFHAGSAIGLNMSIMGIAGVFAPPIGNWLAGFGTGFAFLFWASIVFLGFTGYFFMRRPEAGKTLPRREPCPPSRE